MMSSHRRQVVLVRHGQAKSTEEDPRRPLSVAGRQQAERMATWLATQQPGIDEIRHSGKARAAETAEIFARRLGLSSSRVRQVSGLGPHDDPRALADGLEGNGHSVVLVGHLPLLARLASQLLVGDPDSLDVHFDNAGTVVLVNGSGSWQLAAVVSQEMV